MLDSEGTSPVSMSPPSLRLESKGNHEEALDSGQTSPKVERQSYSGARKLAVCGDEYNVYKKIEPSPYQSPRVSPRGEKEVNIPLN